MPQSRFSVLKKSGFIKLTLAVLLLVSAFAFTFLSINHAEEPKQAIKENASAVILMYHHVSDDSPPSTSVRVGEFEDQLDYLQENQFNIWSLSQLLAALNNYLSIPDKTVVLTADDGYKSIYTEAFPRLKTLGWPMTLFVNTEPVEKGYVSHASWQELAEMQQAGFEIANHGHTHQIMIRQVNETEDEWQHRVTEDISTAQNLLLKNLPEAPLKILAYPYGEYSQATQQLVAKLGYVGLSQHSGTVGQTSDMTALLRFPINSHYGEIERFGLITHTQDFKVAKETPSDTIVSENPPTLTLTFMTNQSDKSGLIQCFNQNGERLTTDWLNKKQLQITQDTAITSRRSHYTCTREVLSGRYQWFSHLWIRQELDN